MVRLAPGLIALAVLFAAAPAFSQQGPFRIVVLAGEDSVNVIQQKTAVAPLVEVRDRNNNPVTGAVVTFAVQGGKAAAFQGGAATMTVATNAAGQAAAAGFTPLTAGAVNISVEAAIQGQVVTAAITQVNVMTAAEAAAAAAGGAGGGAGSGAGAGAGAAGGGGGLSATTIGIVGGIAAAGAVVGTQVIGDSPVYTGRFAVPVTYTFATCARQEMFSGTLEVEIAESGSTVKGEANLRDAFDETIATTCTGTRQVGNKDPWGMPSASVSGTDTSLTFQAQDSVQAGDGSGAIARVYKFSGTLSESTITGTFELSWQSQTQAVFRFTERQTVTLQKR